MMHGISLARCWNLIRGCGSILAWCWVLALLMQTGCCPADAELKKAFAAKVAESWQRTQEKVAIADKERAGLHEKMHGRPREEYRKASIAAMEASLQPLGDHATVERLKAEYGIQPAK